jgi:hypothetical protein
MMFVCPVFCFLIAQARSQDASQGASKPTTATVEAAKSQRLIPGQSFDFMLNLRPTPEGYGGGTIEYTFTRQNDAHLALRDSRQLQLHGHAELHDGQSLYFLTFPIESNIEPGIWNLSHVEVGQSNHTEVAIPQNISFEIPIPPPWMIHIEGPGTVIAGRQAIFKVILDQPSKSLHDDCSIMLLPDFQSSVPQAWRYPVNIFRPDYALKSAKQSFNITLDLPPDVQTGLWTLSLSRNNWEPPGHATDCPRAEIGGQHIFHFQVEAPLDLVKPTFAQVTVNPSQVNLLEAAADTLRARAGNLRLQLGRQSANDTQTLLKMNLKEAVAELDSTESLFKQAISEPLYTRSINIFFDDIRSNYLNALTVIDRATARSYLSSSKPMALKVGLGDATQYSSPASKAVLKSILHNAKAYEVVARSRAITFNLDVFSNPKGAQISFHLNGDATETMVDHETDWRIENVTRGNIHVKLHKVGYEDREVNFDAIDSTSTSISVNLTAKHGAR